MSTAALAMDATLHALKGHWLVRETIGYLRRTFSRLDVSSRSLFALVEEGSCFAGTLLELALACDRIYHLALPDEEARAPDDRRRTRRISATIRWRQDKAASGGGSTTTSGGARGREGDHRPPSTRKRPSPLASSPAFPTTSTGPTRSRLAIEERVSMNPDALTAHGGEPSL